MLDPGQNPVTEPERECIKVPVPVPLRQKIPVPALVPQHCWRQGWKISWPEERGGNVDEGFVGGGWWLLLLLQQSGQQAGQVVQQLSFSPKSANAHQVKISYLWIYTAPYAMFDAGNIHYEGKRDGVGPWK